jgi:HAE1 family hydrophobic/amphiphilic exporter-1
VVFDSAEDVEASVSSLVEKALLGGLLAIVVIFVFLRSGRATLVTAVSLPTSILAALLFSWAEDLTLNIVTLAGLTIAIGRVVDDAIVVLENSYRYVQQSYDPEEAALKGTTEVASAVTSSTLVTVAVFLPLGLVGGIVSKFFLPLSLTVASALLASLVVAVTIIPVLASVVIKRRVAREGATREGVSLPGSGEPVANGPLARVYLPALRWSLRHRVVVSLLALGVFAGGLAAVPFLGVSFFPQSEERLAQADVELPAGTALEGTAEELEPFEDFLIGEEGIEGYQLAIGGENSVDVSAPLRGENQAQATISLTEEADVGETLDRISEEGERLYGDDFKVQVQAQGPPAGGLEITLTGGDEEALREASERVVDEIEQNGQVDNIESDLSEVSPEILAELDDRRAAEAGLSSSQVPSTLGVLLGGGGSFEVGDQTVAVGVPEDATDSLEEVRDLPLGPDAALSDVAEVREVEAPSAVTRVDGERAVTVTGDITAEDSNAVSTAVGEAVADLDLPDGVTAAVGGESEDIQESFQSLLLAVVVALVLVYLVLVVFFGSLATPAIILLSVPLITAGSFGALLLTGTPLSVPALLGVLLLIGIVVANAILIVDFARNARPRHATVDKAIVEAGRERLRPILMTALATVFALLPLALGIGFTEGGGNAFISSSLAIPVIGGLITSTFLTLFVVPVGYSLLKAGRRRNERGGGDERRTDRVPEDQGDGPPADTPTGAVPVAAGGNRNDSFNALLSTALAVRDEEAPRGDPGQEELMYELGRARGRAEVLEKELERRERELTVTRSNGSRNGSGGLLKRLGR